MNVAWTVVECPAAVAQFDATWQAGDTLICRPASRCEIVGINAAIRSAASAILARATKVCWRTGMKSVRKIIYTHILYTSLRNEKTFLRRCETSEADYPFVCAPN